MKQNRMKQLSYVLAPLVLFASHIGAAPAGTAFTYQGRLVNGTNAANGIYNIKASLYDALTSGNQIGTSQTNAAVNVSNGFFYVTLDFGPGVFDGNGRWLELGVRSNGVAAFTILSPRQNLTATPYAVSASALSGSLPTSQLSGTLPPALLSGVYGGSLIMTNPANVFTGNGAGLNNVNASSLCGMGCGAFWNMYGNSGGTPGSSFLGTLDNQPFEIRVNNQRGFRLEPSPFSPNFIGGYVSNSAAPGSFGGTIGGGGSVGAENILGSSYGTISGGSANFLSNSLNGTISGGCSNQIRDGFVGRPSSYASIGGGVKNLVANSTLATIAGGSNNIISGNDGTTGSSIGGGSGNSISSSYYLDSFNTIAGGRDNSESISAYGAIGGGEGNELGSHSFWATIGGGLENINDGGSTTIGGGWQNEIVGNNDFGWGNSGSTIAGGVDNLIGLNTAGGHSTIAGGAENTVAYTYAQGTGGSIGGGESNLVKGTLATIAGGSLNTAVGPGAAIGGGAGNSAGSQYATIPGGYQARSSSYGQFAHASGQFQDAGDAQTSVYVCRGTTTNAVQTELFLDGLAQRITVPTNSTWALDILVSGRASNGNSAAYQLRCAIKNNAGVISFLPGGPGAFVLGEDVASWDATVVTDSPDQAVVVKVAGAAATSIRWVATVRTVEVTF
jgi:hypothetical protein